MTGDLSVLPAEVEYLLSTGAIRARCANILRAVAEGRSNWFEVCREQLPQCADEVVVVTRRNYPDLHVPYHSRWRHFEAGGIDRLPWLHARLGETIGLADHAAVARAEIDLAVVSVLLDAGAGADWRFVEPSGGQNTYRRSEGLGLASLHLFLAGAFSSDPANPLRADADGLRRLDIRTLTNGFQVSERNPLVGLEGRLKLLHRLGQALADQPHYFGPLARPGVMFDKLTHDGQQTTIRAADLLALALRGLAPIWPADNRLLGHAVGDCWRHPLAGGAGNSAGWVPIHKLSQWLSYSLLEPFERAGIAVEGLDELTALAEYRNGGLLMDTGVIRWRRPDLGEQVYRPSDEAIIEWRALTVALIPAVADRVRALLGMDAQTLPLAKILEGGTWATGRALAQRLRSGEPPVKLDSDGTVF